MPIESIRPITSWRNARPWVAVATVLAGMAAAPLAPAQTTTIAQSLAERLDAAIKEDSATRRTHVGMQVVDVATGEVLFSQHAEKLFTPASNMKVYTAAAALDIMGPDHRFTTTLGTTAPPVDGLVLGDLVLVAGGDPVLSTADLAAMVARLKTEHKIHRIQGGLVIDLSLFSSPPKGPGWAWDDDPDAYNMSVGPLMLDYNVLTVVVEPTRAGAAANVRLAPAAAYPTLFSTAQTIGAGGSSTVTVQRNPFEDVIRVSGEIPAGAPAVRRRLTMHEPAQWARTVLRAQLEAEGIYLDGGDVVVTAPVERAFSVSIPHQSAPLSEILALFNKPSENAIGEMLLHHIGLRADGSVTSWQQGQAGISHWLTNTVGISADNFRVADGSGLSRYNQITAEGTIKLLQYGWNHRHRDVLLASLPVAGVDGTLAGRMRGTPAEGRIKAKTGTMSGVSCLSGYAAQPSGRILAFAILNNGFTASSAPVRLLQDKLCVILAEE